MACAQVFAFFAHHAEQTSAQKLFCRPKDGGGGEFASGHSIVMTAEVTHDRHKLEIDMKAKKTVAEKMQAFWDAEKELKAAMPGVLSPLNVPRLEKAIEVAKANDVHLSNPKVVEAAEKALEGGRAKAELAASKDRAKAELAPS